MAARLTVVSCRWDWCRESFPSIDALDTHVKHVHVWPMKPLRKSEITFMRRMDLQSLHSSPNTDPSIISKELIPGVSRGRTPFLPPSPGQSAAVEMFERPNAHQHLRLPPHQRSPTSRPLSQSSGFSQEVVEQHLTQYDDVGAQHQPLLPHSLQTEDAEPRWPTDDRSDEESQNSQPPTRGPHFRSGSLKVPLGSASPTSQGSRSQSQPIVLQTQAPYSSQDWSQTR